MQTEQIAFWDKALERISSDAQWRENLTTNFWESDYRNSRKSLLYLDALHNELRDSLKDLRLAKRLD
jgi:tripartite-type tricarboxylate transporter receptor subunit TctC